MAEHAHSYTVVVGFEYRRENGRDVKYVTYRCDVAGCTAEQTRKP